MSPPGEEWNRAIDAGSSSFTRANLAFDKGQQYADFQIITRSLSLTAPVADKAVLAAITRELLATLHPMLKGVRLLGVSLSSLSCDQAGDDPQMILAL